MYDLKAIREHLDQIRTALGRRGNDVPWDDLRKLSEERRALTTQVEQLRYELNKGSEEVARLRRAKEPADEAMAAMKQLGGRIKDPRGVNKRSRRRWPTLHFESPTFHVPRSLWGLTPQGMSRFVDGVPSRPLRIHPNRIGKLERILEFWILIEPRRLPEPGFRS